MRRDVRMLVWAGAVLGIAACGGAAAGGAGGSATGAGATTAAVPSPAPVAARADTTRVMTSAPVSAAAAPGTSSQARIAVTAPSTGGAEPTAVARHVAVGGVDLTGIGYDVGNPNAPVVLVDFSDFGCPFCSSFARETAPGIEAEYVRTGKVFLKYVPFVAGMFPNSRQASRAAECAGEQGQFWPMHDSLYANQGAWKQSLAPSHVFDAYARGIGVDMRHYGACYAGQTEHPRTAQATAAADRLGVRATPSFVVNGHPIEGALPLPQFRQVLDDALRESGH